MFCVSSQTHQDPAPLSRSKPRPRALVESPPRRSDRQIHLGLPRIGNTDKHLPIPRRDHRVPLTAARHIGSVDKVRRLIGWRARTSFDEGLARTAAWYRENEAWWRGILRTEASVSSS